MEKKEARSALEFSGKLSEQTKKRIEEALKSILELPTETTKGPTFKPDAKWIDVYK